MRRAADNDFCFDYLPRLTGSHSTYETVMAQLAGQCKGYFLMGENPAVGSANGRLQRLGMANLDWLVVRDFSLIESATWWRDGPEIESGELSTADIGTEVFFMPAAAHTEKAGSFTNTQRMLQWHHLAVEPPGEARSELWFTYHLGRLDPREGSAGVSRRHCTADGSPGPGPDLGLPDRGRASPSPTRRRCWPRSTATTPTGSRCPPTFSSRTTGPPPAAAGSTAASTPTGSTRRPGASQAASRTGWPPEWGWAWPANRRILYNRASADPDGKPWSERKALVWWDAGEQRWTGHDIPDFVPDKAPGYQPPDGATGPDGLSGTDPFIMQADGKAWLFAPAGLVDGPLPVHYEPQESPFRNPLYGQQRNPVRQVTSFRHPGNRLQPSGTEPGAEVFPYVATTYRLTEHHTAGGMSRWLPYLAELQPEFFCEVSPELAAERSLEHLGWATIVTARAAIEARVLVTERMVTLTVDGHRLHQVGLPYHWGGNGLSTGDSANDLIGLSLDPERAHPGRQGLRVRHPPGPPPARAGPAGPGPRLPAPGGHHRADRHGGVT